MAIIVWQLKDKGGLLLPDALRLEIMQAQHEIAKLQQEITRIKEELKECVTTTNNNVVTINKLIVQLNALEQQVIKIDGTLNTYLPSILLNTQKTAELNKFKWIIISSVTGTSIGGIVTLLTYLLRYTL